MTTDPDHMALRARLERFSSLVANRDMSIVQEVWSEVGFRLIGSEDDENASTPAQLTAHFKSIFAKPYRQHWEWSDFNVTRSGETAWVFAEGEVIQTFATHEERCPYRAVCIFQNMGDHWAWRLFSGSEPTG